MRDAYAAYRTKAHDPAVADKCIEALQELVLQGGPGGPPACVALVKVRWQQGRQRVPSIAAACACTIVGRRA